MGYEAPRAPPVVGRAGSGVSADTGCSVDGLGSSDSGGETLPEKADQQEAPSRISIW